MAMGRCPSLMGGPRPRRWCCRPWPSPPGPAQRGPWPRDPPPPRRRGRSRRGRRTSRRGRRTSQRRRRMSPSSSALTGQRRCWGGVIFERGPTVGSTRRCPTGSTRAGRPRPAFPTTICLSSPWWLGRRLRTGPRSVRRRRLVGGRGAATTHFHRLASSPHGWRCSINRLLRASPRSYSDWTSSRSRSRRCRPDPPISRVQSCSGPCRSEKWRDRLVRRRRPRRLGRPAPRARG